MDSALPFRYKNSLKTHPLIVIFLLRGRVKAACPQIARSDHSISPSLSWVSKNKDRQLKNWREHIGARRCMPWNKECNNP